MPPSHLVFPAIGGLLIGLGVPMARRWVPPNRWYGLRLRVTFADERVWYEANAATGRDLVWLGAAALVVALALQRLPQLPDAGYAAACLSTLTLGSIVVLRRGVRLANRLLREQRDSTTPGAA
jgi:uncharacterized membrane protein